MILRRALTVGCWLVASAASAQDRPTVAGLLRDEFAIVGTMNATGGGAAVFLQKKEKLFFCFISETRESVAVTTQYCKPVQ